jgi:hypothetical protein
MVTMRNGVSLGGGRRNGTMSPRPEINRTGPGVRARIVEDYSIRSPLAAIDGSELPTP